MSTGWLDHFTTLRKDKAAHGFAIFSKMSEPYQLFTRYVRMGVKNLPSSVKDFQIFWLGNLRKKSAKYGKGLLNFSKSTLHSN